MPKAKHNWTSFNERRNKERASERSKRYFRDRYTRENLYQFIDLWKLRDAELRLNWQTNMDAFIRSESKAIYDSRRIVEKLIAENV